MPSELDSERMEAGSSGGTTDKVKDKARDVKEQAQEQAARAKSEAKDRGEDLMDEGREKAREMGDRASEMARSTADEQKERVVGGIRTVADALRRGGDELPEDRKQYGRFLETVADRADGVSRYLEERDVDELTREARRVARDHTPLFLGGAFALGMAGARFLKSSGDQAREGAARRRPGTGYLEGPSPVEPGPGLEEERYA